MNLSPVWNQEKRLIIQKQEKGMIPFQSPFPFPQNELAILKFPYDSWGTPFQQLKQVVDEPSPQLPADRFSPEFVDFISQWWASLSMANV